MGGDFAPQVVVEGALQAAQRGIPVLLCGDCDVIKKGLDQLYAEWRILPIDIEPCTQVINMEEEPARGVVYKKDASLVRAACAVKDGRAAAMVSAGNSGAALIASILIIGRVKGVLRPALGTFLSTHNHEVFCLDLGANTDCRADFLEQFAYMGTIYVRCARAIAKPRVGLLSNGHEPYKGSLEVKEAYRRLEHNADLLFVGNVEARDVFDGKADVIISDGFVGNVFLKGIQGVLRSLFNWIKYEAEKSWLMRFSAWCAWPLLKKIKQATDHQRANGGLLLGIRSPVIIVHGNSKADGIYHAIIAAHDAVQSKLSERYNIELEKALRESGKKEKMFAPIVHEKTGPAQDVL
jgi:glycerol-3-phosphate acyltransferase PlsX